MFFKHANIKSGYRGECKICSSIIRKKYYERNKEKLNEISRNYWEEHKHTLKEKYSDYYNKNKHLIQEKISKRRKQYPNKSIYNQAKSRAKLKGIEFSIEIEDIIIPKFCPILNIPLIMTSKIASYNSPSIDRINNEKGYIKNNIIIVSNRANKLKNNASIEELEKIVSFYKGLNK